MSLVSTTVRATHLVTNAAWFGLHLLSGLVILGEDRNRVVMHPPTTIVVVAKTALTAAALALAWLQWTTA